MEMQKFINDWNRRYPFDFYFRKKYNIPFGSAVHRSMNQIDMALDIKEEILIKHYEDLQERKKERDWYNEDLPEERRIGTPKEGVRPVKMTKKELDKEFDNLDLSQFNDPVDG